MEPLVPVGCPEQGPDHPVAPVADCRANQAALLVVGCRVDNPAARGPGDYRVVSPAVVPQVAHLGREVACQAASQAVVGPVDCRVQVRVRLAALVD